ncbi:MAG: hypothetical protein HY801_14700 [Candidatus Lindowbacteria bacterium]|nr:hypothetical protein [Candidatus Lindowbacteria bacterium]
MNEQASRPAWRPRAMAALFAAGALMTFLAGCESLPPGTPPEGTIFEVKAVTTKQEFADKRMALEHMITYVSTICPQIAQGGSPPPILAHKFYFSNPMIDDLPQKLWNSLLRMKAIRPYQQGGAKADYLLLSSIEEEKEPLDANTLPAASATSATKEDVVGPKIFKWTVTIQSGDGNKKLWRNEVVILLNPAGTFKR